MHKYDRNDRGRNDEAYLDSFGMTRDELNARIENINTSRRAAISVRVNQLVQQANLRNL